jgi:hypothetical protein
MKNTSFAISESSTLVAKLLARTEDGKISWNEGAYSSSALENFETELEGGVLVRISSDKAGVTFEVLIKKDYDSNRRILEVYLEHDPSFGFDLPSESELYSKLIELQEFARRSAFNVDQNLASTMDYLERLAG